MRGFGLFKGRQRGRCVEIGLDEDSLWALAWGLAGFSIMTLPIKFKEPHKADLRSSGYEVRPIQFERAITNGKTKKG